jgi:hypothetical protein
MEMNKDKESNIIKLQIKDRDQYSTGKQNYFIR